jgi:hypothetical protein
LARDDRTASAMNTEPPQPKPSVVRRLWHKVYCVGPYNVQHAVMARKVEVEPGFSIPLMKWKGKIIRGWFAWRVNPEDMAKRRPVHRRTCTRCGIDSREVWGR